LIMGGVRQATNWVNHNVLGNKQGELPPGTEDAIRARDKAALPPLAPDATDEAVQNARIMERRRQIGMNGRMSTFLTTSGGDSSAYNAGAQTMNNQTTVLGG
jgi:hypothetical protein